ncbi:DUF4335 domain-containing protein [Leptothoe sp. PORK10 BA2]|uniref:DUF4335 domain-containing protein n=1 Tax=Leptothoe sp. PORK10 BA2 TaxID=3110254 RepID=UPI002B1FBE63|nr:DUF4335 domain-containing protein [Leptothoe sp. PORK10 BA2]MEA5466576.1 DUF4335 domain-containing protein [Leptothoe sp. PORK10 BA2]
MSPVLPIDTQRYSSGDYTLEVTAHQSALSQWSDRPVVRQLRFSLWSGQQRLITGDQQHLVVVSDAVEAYVQTHLTHQAWPQNHRLEILDQQLELTTLQLFDLAEVLSAYGQHQITLPRAAKALAKAKTQRPWVSSAAASLLVAVGVTTAVYLRDRPAGLNDFVTSQSPQSTELEEGGAAAPQTAPSPEASSDASPERLETRPGTGPSSTELGRTADEPSLKINQDLARQQNAPQTEATDIAPTASKPLDEDVAGFELDSGPEDAMPEIASAEAPAAPSPAASVIAPTAETAIQPEANLESGDTADAARDPGSGSGDLAASAARQSGPQEDGGANGVGRAMLDAIATQLAPYQPTGSPYPLVYHLQIAPNGRIMAIERISENAPAIAPAAISPAPGRPLRVEVIYTGANRPVVNELFE